MKDKINIAEILKDCPQGMELDCTLFEGLEFDGIVDNEYLPIRCRIKNPNGGYNVYNFTKYGCWLDTTFAKCIIFPKGKTTWKGFHRPFKDGEVVVYDNPYREHLQIFIFKDKKENNTLSTCYLMLDGDELVLEEGAWYVTRIATEEEKQKLFDAIKANSYKWNEETKTLEKLIEPKFKVGDRIQSKNFIEERTIKICEEDGYWTTVDSWIRISDQDNWELVPNKFDITTLKPFDKVLVRYKSFEKWNIQFFDKYNTELGAKYPFICLCNSKYCQCIPYEGNEHLLGKTDSCDDFYKTW